MIDRYESPLSTRYASEQMLQLFSAQTRAETWRRLWTQLARAQMQLGLPITQQQVAQLEAHIKTIDFETEAKLERETRHDVMAHIKTYGLDCPDAAGIIHLGATSCYVTDNADLVLYRTALRQIRQGLLRVMRQLADFALRYKDLPTLGYTHLQPAQPVTVGKRATLWLQDLMLDLEELDEVIGDIRFLGCRGTTGTEASFMDLFDGDTDKIDRMNRSIAQAFGFTQMYPVCGQTYPRKLDSRILNVLSSVCQSAYRFAGDLRILQHDRQMEEPFADTQVGSSAMAYKRNPMRCERICSLARYVMVNAQNAPLTASLQWMERTLDDSANRRISLPESFLATDGVLRIMENVTSGMRVNEAIVARELETWLPFMATENLMMEAVRHGGDRQKTHEIIRRHSMAATERMKQGLPCDLTQRLAGDPTFALSQDQIASALDPAAFIGRCGQQVELFVQQLAPILAQAETRQAEDLSV